MKNYSFEMLVKLGLNVDATLEETKEFLNNVENIIKELNKQKKFEEESEVNAFVGRCFKDDEYSYYKISSYKKSFNGSWLILTKRFQGRCGIFSSA